MYTVYVLKSDINGRYYIGHTEDLEMRLKRHNDGEVRSTKRYRPWKVICSEIYATRSDARRRELEIKKYKGGIKFKILIGIFSG
jgi:putative endonuclease